MIRRNENNVSDASGRGGQGTAIEAMKKSLQSRLKVLDANRKDRNPEDAEQSFTRWQEQQTRDWLSDDDKFRHQEEEYVYLFISSAMRDRERWPNSAQFKITLQEEIDNVIKAELIQASIPLIDPQTNVDNNFIRYSFAPHTGATIKGVRIPIGAYQGTELALEVQTQMNLDLHSGLITGGFNFMNHEIGYVVTTAGGTTLEATIDQFRVQYLRARHIFIIQLVDDTEEPINTPAFAIHWKLTDPGGITSDAYRFKTDDMADLLGFERIQYSQNGTFDAGSDTYYIINTTNDPDFGPAADVDARYSNSIHSNQAADLRGNLAVVLDIDPLNDNDIAIFDDDGAGAICLADYFGFIVLRDASFVNDRMAEINNNSFPIRKYYREGRSRIKDLCITHRRPDGTIVNYGNIDHFMTIRLTVKRTNGPKPMFAR